LARSNQPHRAGAESISLCEARLLALAAQRLDVVPRPPAPADKTAILEMIRTLGCVQLDTISVVARSHETVLWSRLGHYDPALIGDLYDPDALINEYWAHAAAIVPFETLHYFRRRMARYRDPASDVYLAWAPDHDLNDSVLATIRERGPLPSRAFERPDGPPAAAWSWWGGKPASKALDYLWTCGELTIFKRDGFQRVYELMDRRHPEFHAQPLPSEEEQRRFFVSRSLAALGIATPKWVADYFRTGGRAHVPLRETAAELAALETAGLAVPIAIPNLTEPAWLDSSLLPLLIEIRAGRVAPTRTVLLSPFDNLIWHRDRTLSLFGFDYRLESYTPAPKRRYGYYTLPILHRGQLVGRLDPSYDRKRRVLTIKAIHLEPGVPVTRQLANDLTVSLREYSAFLGAGHMDVVSTFPEDLRAKMTSLGGEPAQATRSVRKGGAAPR
jgi:uncharacterized protein